MLAVELAERAAHHADEDCLAAAEGELLAVHVMTAGLAVMAGGLRARPRHGLRLEQPMMAERRHLQQPC